MTIFYTWLLHKHTNMFLLSIYVGMEHHILEFKECQISVDVHKWFSIIVTQISIPIGRVWKSRFLVSLHTLGIIACLFILILAMLMGILCYFIVVLNFVSQKTMNTFVTTAGWWSVAIHWHGQHYPHGLMSVLYWLLNILLNTAFYDSFIEVWLTLNFTYLKCKMW